MSHRTFVFAGVWSSLTAVMCFSPLGPVLLDGADILWIYFPKVPLPVLWVLVGAAASLILTIAFCLFAGRSPRLRQEFHLD